MAKKIKVLLVDDEAEFTEPLTYWLEAKNYSVEVAPEGKSALKLMKRSKPDIVFLDLRMPVMDGIETLQHIRKLDKQLPVIIITVAYADKEKFTQAKKLGCSGFFPKKGTFKELGKLVEVTLRTHKKLKKRR